jgi:hypothetical protein
MPRDDDELDAGEIAAKNAGKLLSALLIVFTCILL